MTILKPIGEPFKLLLSDAWGQHIGTLENEIEVIQATIYGNNSEHVRMRAENFIKILNFGKKTISVNKKIGRYNDISH